MDVCLTYRPDQNTYSLSLTRENDDVWKYKYLTSLEDCEGYVSLNEDERVLVEQKPVIDRSKSRFL